MERPKPLLRYILACCADGFLSWMRPTRICYRRWRPWLNFIRIIVPVIILLWLILAKTFEKPITTSLPYITTIHRSTNIRVPQYLLTNIDVNGQSKCEQIFENIIPHSLKQNLTDKELVSTLFGKLLNPTYAIYSNMNETTSLMFGKYCFNTSTEWIMLKILQKETSDKPTNTDEYLSDENQCSPFDFQKCSLENFNNDYPKLFQFDHEQHIKTFSSMSAETISVIYHYIRRKASDYLRYRRHLIKSDSISLNISILSHRITSQTINIKVKTMPDNVSMSNIECVTTLEAENVHETSIFQIKNPVILFDQLTPKTNYNVCISYPESLTICKSMKTLQPLLTSFQLNKDSIVMTILGFIIIFLLVIFNIAIPKIAILNNHIVTPIDHQTNEENQNTSTDTLNMNTNNEDEQRHETASLVTMTGISVHDSRNSESPVESVYHDLYQ